jgi:hypothetical protein
MQELIARIAFTTRPRGADHAQPQSAVRALPCRRDFPDRKSVTPVSLLGEGGCDIDVTVESYGQLCSRITGWPRGGLSSA